MMRRNPLGLWLLALVWSLFAAWPACAQTPTGATFPTLALSKDSSGRIELGTRMGVLIDSSNTLTLEQALRPDQPWKTIDRKSPNFGFTQDAYWFRFQINNVTDRALPRLIELPIPFLDDVRLKTEQKEKVNKSKRKESKGKKEERKKR